MLALVDEDVEAAERGDRGADEAIRCVGVGDVASFTAARPPACRISPATDSASAAALRAFTTIAAPARARPSAMARTDVARACP